MDKTDWQGAQGKIWASEWRRTDRSFTAVTEKLLQRMRGLACRQVLDIGCGAGELSLAIARGRPDTRVIGVDISPDLVEAARNRASNRANVTFALCDAAIFIPPSDFRPDLLVSRHGVMFFADPIAAFSHLADIAGHGASLLFSCFRSPAENPFFTEVAQLLPEPLPEAPADAPGPFALADPNRIAAILNSAGWKDLGIEAFDFPMIVGAGDAPVEDAASYFSAIGPAGAAARALDETGRTAFLDNLRQLARRNLVGGIVSLRAAGWIVSARKG